MNGIEREKSPFIAGESTNTFTCEDNGIAHYNLPDIALKTGTSGEFFSLSPKIFIAYSDMTYYIKEIIRHVSHATSA